MSAISLAQGFLGQYASGPSGIRMEYEPGERGYNVVFFAGTNRMEYVGLSGLIDAYLFMRRDVPNAQLYDRDVREVVTTELRRRRLALGVPWLN